MGSANETDASSHMLRDAAIIVAFALVATSLIIGKGNR